MDVCGIARLRGSDLKRFELLEEDICFYQPRSMIYDEVVSVSELFFNNIFWLKFSFFLCVAVNITLIIDY